MRIAEATRYQFREAYRHMRRNILDGGEAHNPLVRAYKYGDAVVKAALGDLYGVQTFDVLVYGPDRLLNLILAYKASAKGLRVGIYHAINHQSDEVANAIVQRVSYFHPSFSALIECQLEIEGLGTGLLDAIDNLALKIDEHMDDQGMSLVYQIDGCILYHDTLTEQDESVRCWVEPAAHRHEYPTIERLLFWDQESARRFATEDGKFAEHSLEAPLVLLTGAPSMEMGAIELTRVRCFGEAARPLLTFDYFKGQDRLKDVADALGAEF